MTLFYIHVYEQVSAIAERGVRYDCYDFGEFASGIKPSQPVPNHK